MIMSRFNEYLQFVLRHYRHKGFDPDMALGRFRTSIGTARIWKRRRAIRWVSAAAASAAILISGMALYQSRMNQWEWTTASAVVLPDQSVVRLKDGASLAFQPHRFSKHRVVRLSGTAYFEVAGQSGASFEVLSDEACVRVLGTVFQFAAESGEVDLLEGRVLFSRLDSGRGLEMTGASHAILHHGSEIPVFADPASPNPAVWATGRLLYDDEPLGTVLSELSDLFGCELTVRPASARTRTLHGEFLVSDGIDLIVKAIESALNVTILTHE